MWRDLLRGEEDLSTERQSEANQTHNIPEKGAGKRKQCYEGSPERNMPQLLTRLPSPRPLKCPVPNKSFSHFSVVSAWFVGVSLTSNH